MLDKIGSDLEPFPPPELANPDGLIAIGGDLSTDRLINAYAQGIFPWYSEGWQIQWWTPDPRYVLYVDSFRVSRSLKKNLRNKGFSVSVNTCFEKVIRQCQTVDCGDRRSGSWITDEMLRAYCALHRRGFAHSVEAWLDGRLAGGLYGVGLGRMFCGESMFSARADGSKAALFYLVALLRRWGFPMIDCQLPTEHLIGLGAVPVARKRFLRELSESIALAPPDDAWKPHSMQTRDVLL